MANRPTQTQFPPQTQPQQPGKEYLMHPLPLSLNPHYRPSNKLHGKVALVTGGDSGMGRSVCYHFALEGATVAFTYVKGIEDKDKDDTLSMLCKLKAKDAKDPIAIAADIRFQQNCNRVVEEVVSQYGRIDILVNNAGEMHYSESIEEITEPGLEGLFRTNIFSHFFLTRYALKHMKEGSCIINTASDAAYTGSGQALEYTSSKGAVVSFTRSLALQLIEKGIRVNAVAPGPVWTPLLTAPSLPADVVANLGSTVPMKRIAQPYEIAPSFVFLASNECSSYMTGQVLHPNGGLIINT